MSIRVNAQNGSYDVTIKSGALQNIASLIDLDRKVLVVTDDGVPKEYAQRVINASKEPTLITLASGEASKNFDNFKMILETMLEHDFTRGDCVVAVGGGVVGDISAFCASCYMRGVDFYNIPTTLLAMIDSSIGGKTAIDFCGVKNIVGSFYQPKAVIIDIDTLKTLSQRQLHAGLVEGIKMGATSSKELFDIIKNSENLQENLPYIIEKSLSIKRDVVEKDTKELGLRKVLNFGHTVGHAIESAIGGELLHGECVGIGMLYCSSKEVREEIEKVLEKYNLPTEAKCDKEILLSLIAHDKKSTGEGVCAVIVDEIGSFRFERMSAEELLKGDRL